MLYALCFISFMVQLLCIIMPFCIYIFPSVLEVEINIVIIIIVIITIVFINSSVSMERCRILFATD